MVSDSPNQGNPAKHRGGGTDPVLGRHAAARKIIRMVSGLGIGAATAGAARLRLLCAESEHRSGLGQKVCTNFLQVMES